MTAVAVVRMRDLFAVVMLTGIYSLLSASFFVIFDAVDVAFTEAAVGAGISTLLMLSTLTLTGRYAKEPKQKPFLALAIVTVTGALLIYGTLDMPAIGSPNAPIHQHVAPRYLNDSMQEIAVPNVVTSILASYRGYDTLGEAFVIFTAGIGVLALLMVAQRRRAGDVDAHGPMHQHLILRIIAKILIPVILMFALYVQFHGDYGPGGGFQAGVIFAAAIILYAMLFGLSAARQAISQPLIYTLSAVGVLLYGGVGIACMLLGDNYLDYGALAEDPVAGQHLGILLVELGVGITVASVMIIIFFSFNGRALSERGVRSRRKRERQA